ncbi:MAG: hypothetical protein SNJ78_08510, partial [Spirochaetales bacterium]
MHKKTVLTSLVLLTLIGTFGLMADAESSLLYGNTAAKADSSLTVEKMLLYALQDEYLARAEYVAIMEKY